MHGKISSDITHELELSESEVENFNQNKNIDDTDGIFQLSSNDHSRDELSTDFIEHHRKLSDVDSVVPIISEDEISLYSDALSRKTSFVSTKNTIQNNFHVNNSLQVYFTWVSA